MLTAYIAAAMRRATYDLLPGEGFAGEIPSLQGVLGYAETLEARREDLQSALEAADQLNPGLCMRPNLLML
jgi:hypothetical protein